MAKDKNSFILYSDIVNTIGKLSDIQAGKLFKHILMYVNDTDPKLDDFILEIAFEPIKQSLKRDLMKYETRQETARANGLKGGRPKNPAKANESKKTQSVILKPRKAVSVSVSDSVSEDQKTIAFFDFYSKYPLKKSKTKAEQYWDKLSDNERLLAINGITHYNDSVKDKTFLKHPSTYLNQKVWLDGDEPHTSYNPMDDPKNAQKIAEGYKYYDGVGWTL